MARLPVYRVTASATSAERADEIARSLFGARDPEVTEEGGRVYSRSPKADVEVDAIRGGVWASVREGLWDASAKPVLPSDAEAADAARRAAARARLLPELDGPFRMVDREPVGTVVAHRTNGSRSVRRLDVQQVTDVVVDVSDHGVSGVRELPLVGGGGRFRTTVGDKGAVLAHHGVWRPVAETIEAELIPQAKADEQFRKLTEKVNVVDFSASLAYYSAPAFTEQEYLTPVYVYRAEIEVDGRRMPMRNVLVPATEYGPVPTRGKAQPKRAKRVQPRIRPLPRDLTLEAGKPLPVGLRLNRRLARERGINVSSLFAPNPKVPGGLIIKPNLPVLKLKELANLLGYFSHGASWIGVSGGLGGSQGNAQGFVDELTADGWDLRFNWGDGNAWESDWRTNDDDWVDAVDFVFYTGHADMNGWMLSSPDDGSLHYAEVGSVPEQPGDLWGAQNLEWLVVAACGPLQDEVISTGGGDIFDRWDGAFDGLHLLLAYGAVTFDNEEEGRRLIRYAREGQPLINAWFRTAQEIQPSTNGYEPPDGPTVYVSAMYPVNSDANPGNDHLFGHGPVSTDPTGAKSFVGIWSPC